MDDLESEGRGSRSIGGLVTQIASSLRISDSMPPPSPTNSGTTGLPSLARRDASSTGRQLSATDAATLLRDPAGYVAAGGDLARVDGAIVALLPPSIASTLRPVHRDFIDPVYGFDTELVGYEMPATVPAEDRMRARQIVGRHLEPAPAQVIKRELARLRVSTKARAETEDDLAMGFQVLAEECANYPADVVVWALRGWAKAEVFYPSLAELRDRLQRGVKRRKSLVSAVG